MKCSITCGNCGSKNMAVGIDFKNGARDYECLKCGQIATIYLNIVKQGKPQNLNEDDDLLKGTSSTSWGVWMVFALILWAIALYVTFKLKGG